MKKETFILAGIFIGFLMIGIVSSQENNEFNKTINQTDNETIIITETWGVLVKKVVPNSFDVGDAQFSIQIENKKNESMENVIGFVSGRGFSTYNVVPIEILRTGETGYLLVLGNFRESGNVTLNIRIGDEVFYQNVSVTNPNENEEEQQRELERVKQERLDALSEQLREIKQNYSALEFEIQEKKDNDYDVSRISLDDAKRYIRNAESSLLSRNADDAEINIQLAIEELTYQKERLDKVRGISFVSIIKEYAVIFSAIAGALITFFALSELLKRKSYDVATTVSSVKRKIVHKEKEK